MRKSTSLLALFALLSLATFSQINTEVQRECRITGGIGFAGATKNTKSAGQDFWLQLDYNYLKIFPFFGGNVHFSGRNEKLQKCVNNQLNWHLIIYGQNN